MHAEPIVFFVSGKRIFVDRTSGFFFIQSDLAAVRRELSRDDNVCPVVIHGHVNDEIFARPTYAAQRQTFSSASAPSTQSLAYLYMRHVLLWRNTRKDETLLVGFTRDICLKTAV